MGNFFHHIKKRLWEYGQCPVHFLMNSHAGWPYGRLLIVPVLGSGGVEVVFGDMATLVNTAEDLAQLIALAQGDRRLFTEDLGWRIDA